MTNFIPIFPLGIVVYPGENVNLHIFESRYKQLIKECHDTKKPFGIPTVLKDKLQDYGTLVEITELSKLYESGEMDIKSKGIKVFQILEVIKELPDKLYSGAIVTYPDSYEKGSPDVMRKVMVDIRQLHQVLNISKDFHKEDAELDCYEVAHHIGFSLEEEYDLLRLMDERQRQVYLKQHLSKVLPMVAEMEHLKEKIKLNGHFKNISGFKL